MMFSSPKSNKKRKHASSSDEDSGSDDRLARKKRSSISSTSSPRKSKTDDLSDIDLTDDDIHEKQGEDDKQTEVLSPLVVAEHVRKLKEMFSGKPIRALSAIKQYVKTVSGVDENALQHSLHRYLTLSLRPSAIDISTGVKLLETFCESPAVLKFMPDYPAPPKPLINIYAAQKGLHYAPANLKQISSELKNDAKGREKAEKEAARLKADQSEALSNFLLQYSTQLSPKQLKFVQGLAKRRDREINPEKYQKKTVPKENGKRKKSQPKTAFEYFLSLTPLTEKYKDMDPEKRMRKLQKKFDKLDENVREVYEKLALRDGGL